MAELKRHGPPGSQATVRLIEEDGNAFAVMGRCQRAAREAGWTKEQIDALLQDMRSGDYDHLLGVAMANFEVE